MCIYELHYIYVNNSIYGMSNILYHMYITYINYTICTLYCLYHIMYIYIYHISSIYHNIYIYREREIEIEIDIVCCKYIDHLY